MPTTARNQRGATPATSRSVACASSISAAIRFGPSAQNHADGWLALWLPRVCPRRTISCTSAGRARARSATTKNVALAPYASSSSRIAGVSSDGPSSMVSQATGAVVGRRVSTGPNSDEVGRSVPHRDSAWLASSSGRPMRQPKRHHTATTTTCDSSAAQAAACGRRGGLWMVAPSPIPASCTGGRGAQPRRRRMDGPPTPVPAMTADSLDPALRGRIEALLSAHPVVLFMRGQPQAPQCGFSARAAAALAAAGLDDYAHVDVLSDPEIREGIKVFGDWPTIPQLYIRGELVGGSDIIEQMANSGDLQSAL